MTRSSTAEGQPLVERVGRIADMPADALAVLALAERSSVECGADWLRLLTEHVLIGEADTGLLVLREGGVCQAVWPLRCGAEAGALGSYYTALYQPAHASGASPEGMRALAGALRRQGIGRGAYLFGPMDPEAPSFSTMEQALRQAGLATFRYYRFGNWYLPSAGVNWAQYFAARKGGLRSTVRRMGKKFSADGGTMELITGGDRLEAGIAAYDAVYASSWRQAEPYPQFIRVLMGNWSERGWLRLGVAWLDGKPIAAQLWTVAHGRAEIFKVAYDEAYKASNVATLLTAMLMEHVLDQDKVDEVDYLIGDDSYKKIWMTHRRERWGLAAYDPLTVAGALGIARHLGGQLRRRLRKTDAPAATQAAVDD